MFECICFEFQVSYDPLEDLGKNIDNEDSDNVNGNKLCFWIQFLISL